MEPCFSPPAFPGGRKIVWPDDELLPSQEDKNLASSMMNCCLAGKESLKNMFNRTIKNIWNNMWPAGANPWPWISSIDVNLLLSKRGWVRERRSGWEYLQGLSQRLQSQTDIKPTEGRKSKTSIRQKERERIRLARRHWSCPWSPPISHRQTQGHRDRSIEKLWGVQWCCGTEQFWNAEEKTNTNEHQQHHLWQKPAHQAMAIHRKVVDWVTPDL